MGNIGSGSGSSYPTSLDYQASLEIDSPSAGKTKARAAVPNDIISAVLAMETELGTDPAGSLTDVKTFLQTEHNTDGTHNTVSISTKGLCPQAPNNTTQFLRADATWSNLTYPTPNQLVWSKTISSGAVTTLTSPTLDLSSAYAYDYIILIYNPTASNVLYALYYNNNTTATDYRRNWNSGESNDPYIHYTNIQAGGRLFVSGTIMQTPDGYVCASHKALGINSSGVGSEATAVMHWKVTAVSGSNLTRVDITGSVSSSIGNNSTTKWWKRKGFDATTEEGTTS